MVHPLRYIYIWFKTKTKINWYIVLKRNFQFYYFDCVYNFTLFKQTYRKHSQLPEFSLQCLMLYLCSTALNVTMTALKQHDPNSISVLDLPQCYNDCTETAWPKIYTCARPPSMLQRLHMAQNINTCILVHDLPTCNNDWTWPNTILVHDLSTCNIEWTWPNTILVLDLQSQP